jgi:DNA invertase Pin-like site-specific DNA recombinase
MLDNIRDLKIDVVVVYKVDRLTRSLADFAKIVEVFDAQGYRSSPSPRRSIPPAAWAD